MRRHFCWSMIGLLLLLTFDGCRAGPQSDSSHAWSDFRRNIVQSIESPDSTRWVARPDVYGTDDPMNSRYGRGFTSRRR
jgi:hypothetical protein